MKCPVFYEGKEVGWVNVQQEQSGVSWKTVCKVDTLGVLRLYGLRAGREPLRIGVLEPEEDGTLHLDRLVSQGELEAIGYDTPPETYILSENGQGNLHTGDAKLDTYIDRGQAECRLCDGRICVCVPFAPGKACPLAFALTACSIQNGEAVLWYNRKTDG